jgi:hypothetical protein
MTFQERYNVTEAEKEALVDRVEKMILGEVTMSSKQKATEAVDALMNVRHLDDAETVTIQWGIQQGMGVYKTMIGEIRNEASKDNRSSGKN